MSWTRRVSEALPGPVKAGRRTAQRTPFTRPWRRRIPICSRWRVGLGLADRLGRVSSGPFTDRLWATPEHRNLVLVVLGQALRRGHVRLLEILVVVRRSLALVALLLAIGCGRGHSREAGPRGLIFYVPTGAMEHTLLVGDRILVQPGLRIDRGTVIVFRGPPGWPGGSKNQQDFVKRVIGLAGDTISCCDSKGRVILNGHPLNEPYVYGNLPQPFGPVKVPIGELWVMGDFRSQSADSREFGAIPVKYVVGVATEVLSPPSQAGPIADNSP